MHSMQYAVQTPAGRNLTCMPRSTSMARARTASVRRIAWSACSLLGEQRDARPDTARLNRAKQLKQRVHRGAASSEVPEGGVKSRDLGVIPVYIRPLVTT